MALKLTVTTPHGILVSDAYHRVEQVRITGKDGIKFQLRSYTTPDFPHFSDAEHSAPYIIDGENPITQAYEHIKMLPEFLGAIDC